MVMPKIIYINMSFPLQAFSNIQMMFNSKLRLAKSRYPGTRAGEKTQHIWDYARI